MKIFGADYDTADGTALRDFIHVDDLALAHVQILEKLDREERSGPVNLGRGKPTSVLSVIELMRKVSRREIRALPAPRRPGDPEASWADATLACRQFGWTPRRDIDEIVRSAWLWHSQVPESLI